MEENKKFSIKEAAQKWLDETKAFFKDFKWDKAHVTVLLKYLFEALFFAFIITFDLCMKDYLYGFLEAHGGNYTVIKGFLDLTYSENTGMGFGLFKDGTVMLTVMTAIVIFVIIVYLLAVRKDKAYIRIPLIMVAAGGIGNLVDRIALGYVRDFFEFTFMDFAIFNIADAFVTVGAIVLIIGLLIMLVTESKGEWKANTAENNGENGGNFTIEAMDGSADNADCGNKENADGNADGESKHADNAAENNAEESGETKEPRDSVKFTVTAEPENTSNQSDNADGEERK